MHAHNQLHTNALELFEAMQYEQAFLAFDKLGLKYEAGYCLFALGKHSEAYEMWENSKLDSPAVCWGFAILSLINLTIPKRLTFFQIRNFLERDLKVLLQTKQLRAAENVISAADILVECNPESYKFIGRVLLNTGYFQIALEFLRKARDVCFSDAEVQQLLAEYYVAINDVSTAIKILNKALVFNPNYFPARNMLKKLKEDN